jgi:hypothetical protein
MTLIFLIIMFSDCMFFKYFWLLLSILIVNLSKASQQWPHHNLNTMLALNFLCQIN